MYLCSLECHNPSLPPLSPFICGEQLTSNGVICDDPSDVILNQSVGIPMVVTVPNEETRVVILLK